VLTNEEKLRKEEQQKEKRRIAAKKKRDLLKSQNNMIKSMMNRILDNVEMKETGRVAPKLNKMVRYSALKKMKLDDLRTMAKQHRLPIQIMNQIPTQYHAHTLPYIMHRAYHGKNIGSPTDIAMNGGVEMIKEIARAGKGPITTKTLSKEDRQAVAMMLSGASAKEAFDRAKTGVRGQKYRLTIDGKTYFVKLSLLEQMHARHPKLNMEQLAYLIVSSRKRNKGESGFNYQKNRFINADGNSYNGPSFAKAYNEIAQDMIKRSRKNSKRRNINKNSNSNSNNNSSTRNSGNRNNANRNNAVHMYEKEFHPKLHNLVVATLSQKETIAESIKNEPVRVRVQNELFSKIKTDMGAEKDPLGLIFAKNAIMRTLAIGGPLSARPLFMGNVGKPNLRVGAPQKLTPIQQIKEMRGDGCVQTSRKWHRQGYSLSVHQAVVQGVCALVAMGYVKAPGFLAFHSVGAGKTVMSLGCIVAFWNTDTCIIPASARSNNREGSNDLQKLAMEAIRYFPWFRSKLVGEKIVGNATYKFEEFPFARGAAVSEEQLKMRLRYGHALKGHREARALTNNHLLNTYTTSWNIIQNKHATGLKYKPNTTKLTGYVFICDELQLLFNIPSTEEAYRKQYEAFYNLLKIGRDPKTTFALGLTATPGENKEDVLRVFETLTAREMKSLATIPQNMVSSAYVSGDTSFFPRVIVKKECAYLARVTSQGNLTAAQMYTVMYFRSISQRPEMHGAVSSIVEQMNFQPLPVIKTYPNQRNDTKMGGDLSKVLLKHARQVSEYIKVSPSSVAKMMNGMDDMMDEQNGNMTSQHLFDEMKRHVLDPRGNVVYARTCRDGWDAAKRTSVRVKKVESTYQDSMFVLSPKTTGVINSLLDPKNRGVHFVYGRNWNTLKLIAHVLQTRHGWKMYDAKSGSTSSTRPRFGFINSIPTGNKTRFLNPAFLPADFNMGTRTFPAKAFTPALIEQQKGTSATTSLLRVIEDDRNKYGAICRVVFATHSSFKGVNTKNLRHIHCITALPRWTDLIQLVGRGTRFKGHCGVVKRDRNVTIHTWRLEPPKAVHMRQSEAHAFPDAYIYDFAYQKYAQGFGAVLNILLRKSIDGEIYGEHFTKLKEMEDQLKQSCVRVHKDTAIARNKSNVKISSQNNVKELKTAELIQFVRQRYGKSVGRRIDSAEGKRLTRMLETVGARFKSGKGKL